MANRMRTTLTAMFLVALAMPAFAQAPAGKAAPARKPTGISGDEASIRRLMQEHDQARNKGDWKALSALFTDDADQLTSAGEWRRGRAEIEQGVARLMGTTYKGGKYTTKIDTVRILASSVAIADGAFEITNIAGGGSRRGHTTYALVKSAGLWRIAVSRAMVPTPVGATPPR